jgi:two-component system, OmpR family, KDP operon response regulator KdpE
VIKLLLIEDDQQAISDISFSFQLRFPDVSVLSAENSRSALETLEMAAPNLIILDSSLQGINIINFIGLIRQRSEAPLLVLGKSETDFDRSRGLEAGADIYICKPYSHIELVAMCNALLRRSKGNVSVDVISFDELTIDFVAREVFLCGKAVELTPIEYRLLSELAKNANHVVPIEELLIRVWGPEYLKDIELVKAYVYRLRRKLDSGNSKGWLIFNERGFGYRLGRERPDRAEVLPDSREPENHTSFPELLNSTVTATAIRG